MMFNKVLDSSDSKDFAKNIIMFVILVLIMSFIIRYLWNAVLVPHITILKPVTTLLDALLLSFALNLLR
jgi:hypothetical protein